MAKRIQLRGDTAANWTSVNPVLAQRELGIETDTFRSKVGDGVTAWNALTYFVDPDARGPWNPTATNGFPTSGGRGPGGVPRIGDKWRISHSGSINGVGVEEGTVIEAWITTPGQTLANWKFYY